MIINKKYLLFSFLFIASISLHAFNDHHDHFDLTEEHISECQACEENVEIQLSKTKTKQNYLKNQPTTDLISCLLYTSPSPRDAIPSRMPSSA